MKPSKWEQYQQLVDLYQYYLDLAVKGATGFWVIAAGSISIAYAAAPRPGMRWILAVPALLAVSLLVLSLAVAPKARALHNAIRGLAESLDLEQRVHSELLVYGIYGFSALMFSFAGLLGIMIVNRAPPA